MNKHLAAFLGAEPYGSPPVIYGNSPRGRDEYTEPNGGYIAGAPWNADFRGEHYVAEDYQGYGESYQVWSSKGPTDWDGYQIGGPNPQSGWPQRSYSIQAVINYIPGYAGTLQDFGMPVQLRAGQGLPFPTSGMQDPGADPILFELTNPPGYDVGWQLHQWFTPRQLFNEPPNFSEQTVPQPAAGWP